MVVVIRVYGWYKVNRSPGNGRGGGGLRGIMGLEVMSCRGW